MVAIDIKDKARKRALFLHTAGFKVQDILDMLKDTGDYFETSWQASRIFPAEKKKQSV